MLSRIEEIGIIPAVRASSADDALFASRTLFSAGIPIVEITMTTPGAADVIAELKGSNEEVIVGAGTVLDLEEARICLGAGAAFLTSTGLDPEILAFALKNDVAMIPGALTPTEVMMARKAGGDFVKVFPCSSVGGASYIRALKGPFPHIRLVASGGVNQQTAAQFIHAGANAIGVGRELLPHEAIRQRNQNWIRELARRFLGIVKNARSERPAHGAMQ